MKSIEAFPLAWPAGYIKTKSRRSSSFRDATFARTRDGVIRELRLLGAKLPVISSNIPLRGDGLPYSGYRETLPDPGISVYFQFKGKQMVLACDRYFKVTDNLRAIELTIEAMRGMERWGVSDMLERAFSGFAALPPPVNQGGTQQEKSWWEILNVSRESDLDYIESVYRWKMKKAHPDAGGKPEEAVLLNNAIASARNEKSFGAGATA